MDYRTAVADDAPILARMNQQLIRDEGHRSNLTLPELERRMRGFLQGNYEAVLFGEGVEYCGYALYRRDPDWLYIRQFFVRPEFRRRGIGRAAIEWLAKHRWADAPRLRIEVLVNNPAGQAFWKSLDFHDYCITMERPVATASRPTHSGV